MNDNAIPVNPAPALTMEEICSKMKELAEIENVKSALPDVKELNNEWKKIPDEQKQELSEQYKKSYRKYFSKLKFVQQTEEWERWENYTKKMLLCEKIEKLQNETDMYKVSKDMSDIWNHWRNTGSVPKEHNEEIWNRFNNVRKILSDKCRAFFDTQKEEQEKNLVLKKELCAKAEALKDSTDLEQTAQELKLLQEEWKKIGRAPQPFNDELFNAFRTSCNSFFENRINFYNNLHARQAENKNQKKDLCREAEQLSELPYEQAVKKVRDLKYAWNSTGSSGKKDEEKLWTTFNKTIDSYFEKVDAERPLNLEKKQKICTDLEAILNNTITHSSAAALKQQIDELKKLWQETGHVPRERENEIKSAYSNVMQKLSELYYSLKKEDLAKYIDELHEREILIEELVKISGQAEAKSMAEEIQAKWTNLQSSLIPQSETEALNSRFNHILNGTADLSAYSEKSKNDNMKQRIKLCIKMEQISGSSEIKEEIQEQNVLSLAEELKLAIENNFASPKAGRNSEQPERYENLLKKWHEIGPVCISEFKLLYNRFYSAVNRYENKNRPL